MKRRSRCSFFFASLPAGAACEKSTPRLVRIIARAAPRFSVRALAGQREAGPPDAEVVGVVQTLPVAEHVEQAGAREYPQRAAHEERYRPHDYLEDEAVERDAEHHGVARHALVQRIFALHDQVRISSTIRTAPKTTTIPMIDTMALRLSIIPYFIR